MCDKIKISSRCRQQRDVEHFACVCIGCIFMYSVYVSINIQSMYTYATETKVIITLVSANKKGGERKRREDISFFILLIFKIRYKIILKNNRLK